MAYVKTIWKDRVVERPRTYNVKNNEDGTITLIPSPGVITEEGTPISSSNMNKIEEGIVSAKLIEDSTTNKKYVIGVENGLLYVQEV